MDYSLIERACILIPATPDMIVQVMTHVHEADENTFAIICTLFYAGYKPKQLSDGLNELHSAIGVGRILDMAKSLSALDVETWQDAYPILNQLTTIAVVMIGHLADDIAVFGDIRGSLLS